MPLNLSRAQRRFLGLAAPLVSRPDHEVQLPSHVTFSFQTRQSFVQHLYGPGDYRGGPLFGFRSDGDLSIQFAAPAGYVCGDPVLRQQPLVMDERYLLGWSDGLAAVYGGKMDWVGQWLMYPDRQLASQAEDARWVEEGVKTDLINDEQVLVSVGWDQGALSARVCGYSRETRQLLTLPHDLAGDG